MACEIYEDLKGAAFIKTDEESCRFEKECAKACEACVFGDLLVAVDQESKDASITPSDCNQSRILAELEAEDAAKKHTTSDDIKAKSITDSLTCIGRVN